MGCNSCSICQKNESSVSFNDIDEKEVKWLTKLQTIVPELESEECFICYTCTSKLEDVLEFRNQVLKLVSRQGIRLKQDSYGDCANFEFDVGDNSVEFNKLSIEIGNQEQNYFHNELGNSKTTGESIDIDISNNRILNFSRTETLETKLSIDIVEKNDKFRKISENVSPLDAIKLTGFNNHHPIPPQRGHESNKCEITNQKVYCADSIKSKQVSTTKNRRGRKPTRICTCEICGHQFNYIKDIISHCVSVHSMEAKNIKPYSCNKCTQRFTSNANYDQHQKYHDKNRDHVCSSCGKSFITKGDLMVHEYTHFNRRNYKCSNCSKAFNTNKNLRTHILVVHTDSSLWKYSCSICEKRFPLKSNHEQHMRRHSGDKQYICHICKKTFVTNSELKRHIALHTNIKPFQCEHCKKYYKESRTLKLHLKQSHSIGDIKLPQREKKYVCHICPSQFYDKQKLSRHLCSHSGVKPFGCTLCDKKFTDKSYLKHHLKTFHNA
ncbi:hypothetical protein JTB14_005040 [Gonioctena quinquepunctata]|nr:hypothetical protein JTB14_005040 [Gonioctena quinquepunctata]